MNHTHIAGHLGADPEVRFTSGGQKVTLLRVACNSRRSGKEETTWWKVTIWGEQFDKMISYLKKGSPVMAFGELAKPEIYTDREGKPQVSLNLTASSLQFSPFGRSQDGKSQSQAGASQPQHDMTQSFATNSASMNSSQTGASSNSSFGSGSFQPSDMAQGQGQSMPSFNDDEIPF